MALPDNVNKGCLAAVVSAGVAASVVTVMPFLFILAVPVAALHAMVIGLPLYALFSRRRRPGPLLCLAGGFAAGILPTATAMLIFGTAELDLDALIGGNDPMTALAAQWNELEAYLVPLLLLGASGAAGGFAFWWVVHREAEGGTA